MVTTPALLRTPPSRNHVLRIPKDSAVYMDGDPSLHWYIVAEGVVRTCAFDTDGGRRVFGFHFAGDPFGLDDGSRLETAEAVTDTKIWCLSRKPTSYVRVRHVNQALWKALANSQATVALLGRRIAHEKLGAFMLLIMRRTVLSEEIQIPMSRQDIADHLGLTYYTVSRGITQLCNSGLISMSGPSRFSVLNLTGLQSLAGELAST